MSETVYHRLAKFLDDLPGGFPATESGVELKILRRLFSLEEAELALYLTLIGESPRVIAYRAKKPSSEVAEMLARMEKKGLVYGRHQSGQEPLYSALQFVVGIYEFQLNKMDPELASLFEEYLPQIVTPELWKEAPQLRTIPIGESIEAQAGVMIYERAEELVRSHTRISLAPCICRQEKEMIGETCVKPLETCMSFGSGADFYVRNEMGRYITQDEALEVLQLAEETGLVLQPDSAQKASFICCCCGCCCGVLANLKRFTNPAEVAHATFIAIHDDDLCDGCGLCQERCQMEALYLDDGIMHVDSASCIGCGLCVTTCPNAALVLERKPQADRRYTPKTPTEKYIHLAKTRGVLDNRKMAGIFLRSRKDRFLAGRN